MTPRTEQLRARVCHALPVLLLSVVSSGIISTTEHQPPVCLIENVVPLSCEVFSVIAALNESGGVLGVAADLGQVIVELEQFNLTVISAPPLIQVIEDV